MRRMILAQAGLLLDAWAYGPEGGGDSVFIMHLRAMSADGGTVISGAFFVDGRRVGGVR